MNIVLMGLPGAGKGTQAEKIVEDFKVVHISTGDMFRAAMANKTEIGLKAKGFIDKGELVPDDVTEGIVQERLSEEDVQKDGYMLDGFPRTLEQANALQTIAKNVNKPIDAVIYIDVKPETLVDRLSGRYICSNCGATYHKVYNPTKVEGTCDVCGGHDFYQREDDKPETVKNRLKVNIEMNTPLIDFYDKLNLLYKINGEQEIDEVYNEVKKVLQNL
ncbi:MULTISPECIES: adenylate kinase [Companilactobacillus]|jgi:adenylate kinase|uniref:Adenylate kinase n=3 Tax=Companilactobacillus TaxID=2767879 RepID=A0A5B7T5J1_9LACO|nr:MULTISPECIES: adenylate kinase [Companilactobacillus]AKP02448.1 adenylate kinase [Companilactobacillus farciminis]AKS50746.1 adenylate kinase [Companilactobacillus farciminis]KRK92379.1 adenylate kinase [Companilactobacillus futsaii JCM 17355]MDG5113864.1 adenylate kinase [Companilactobacillus pabuli]QCX25411.1 adenylate kinase [Companilactobacillus futsaii]